MISQHPIWNAWHAFDFGALDDTGIHDACPTEPLHWIQIGQYKYSQESFVKQVGEASNLGQTLNNIATSIGLLLQQQSDRDMPLTDFSRGFSTGKLCGHEMSGMMLVLSATLRSTTGINAILSEATAQQKIYFKNDKFIRDWSLLAETQLQFEQWLKLKEMPVADVECACTKVRELMSIFKVIGKREKGMGCRTLNFHGTIHVPLGILNYGVPTNINSFANECHHKKDKKTTLRTQKRSGECCVASESTVVL